MREGESFTVGRGPECGLILADSRVSKLHARVEWDGEGWRLQDLGSKNGTSVDGAPAAERYLASGSWISFGGVTGRFDRLSETDAQALDAHRQARLQTSLSLRQRLGAHLEPVDLLRRFLESAMEVVGAKRGFVLLTGPDARLSVELAAGYTPEVLSEEEHRFEGSLGAVQRALEAGASVVVSDAQTDPYLGKRPSVVALGLGAIACIPIRHDGRILGLIYVDSHTPRTGFCELDLEILEGLADHIAVAIASIQLDEKLQSLMSEPKRTEAEGKVVRELQRRIGDAVKVGATAGPTA